MTSIIYNAYEKHLQYTQKIRDLEYKTRKSYEEHSLKGRGKLWPSDIGKCHRAAILRSNHTGGEGHFTTTSLDYINTGNYTELQTLEALKHVYAGRLTEQVALKYEMWSGKVDFGIDIGTDNPILIEHKTTSENNFGYDGNTELPKKEHIGQAVTYMWLYEKIYGITPTVILFYKAWGNFGEFRLIREGDNIRIESDVNGVFNTQIYKYDVYAEIETLMDSYVTGILPPRLDKQYKGCTFMGKPSCKFFGYCWGEDLINE